DACIVQEIARMSLIIPSLIPLAIRWQGRSLARRLDAAATDPAQAQRSLLQELLTRHQSTAFGQDHGFDRIHTPADYQTAVPIREYEGLRPYVNRMMQGEANVLVRDPVQMFTLTSGTTGQPKYIPVTTLSETRNANLMRHWLYRLLHHHPRCLNRAIVGIVSPAVEGHTPSGIPYGSLSGRIYQQLPRLVRDAYAIPYPVFEIKDYDTRYWAIARFALARQVSFVGTPNPSTLLRLASVIESHHEALIRAIHDGTLGMDQEKSGLEAPAFHHLCTRLQPHPSRARELEQLLNRAGMLHPKHCWPQLQVIGCWTGGSVGIQAQRLAKTYGNATLRDLGYLASEARVTMPMGDRTPSGVLDVTLNYCEFIPEEALDEENPPILLSHELEVSKRYSILLTTPGGLYRYHINDIVEVTGFYHHAPIIAFVRKGKDMSNLTGEKLHVNQLLMAIAQVQQQFNLAIGQVQWVANLHEMNYHIYAEWEDRRGDRWIQQTFLPAVDEALGRLNSEYAQKRLSQRLQPLCLHRMRSGWADAVTLTAIAKSGRDVQYKWRVLCPDGNVHPLAQDYEDAFLHQQ
ncbi:MAG: GH3 auxin-responsive promoter family protein, partial [Cyanobacteria bacterium P01_A01_bin.37]